MDVAAVNLKHIRLDENDRYKETIDSGLNNCLSVEANLDQTGRAFIQDLVASMLDEGCVAAVPTDADDEPEDSGNFKVYTLRTGKILEWYPRHVKVGVYNEQEGQRQQIIIPKSTVPLIENPMYSVMNEPNSIYQRLVRKLTLLDVVDEQTSSGKLDLIIQLPYIIKTEARREQAEKRRKDIEKQLSEGKYGIAYTDGTERITQLNRPVENNLMKQIEYLTSMFFSQLGMGCYRRQWLARLRIRQSDRLGIRQVCYCCLRSRRFWLLGVQRGKRCARGSHPVPRHPRSSWQVRHSGRIQIR